MTDREKASHKRSVIHYTIQLTGKYRIVSKIQIVWNDETQMPVVAQSTT